MARTPLPPGPPPRHHRSVAGQGYGPDWHGSATTTPITAPAGVRASRVTAISAIALTIGLVVGVLAGRASVDGEGAAPPVTRPSTTTTLPTGETIPPASAPPGTELPPSGVGTAESPVAAGEPYVIGLYTIEVVDFDSDATDEVLAESALNIEPLPTETYVLVRVRISFNERSGLGNAAAVPLSVTDGTTTWLDAPGDCAVVPDALAAKGMLGEGDSVEGNACYRVPQSSVDTLVLFTEGFAGPIYFALPG